MISLGNKNIIITGASSGIGRECAIVCSKIGAKLVLVARDQTRLNETLEKLYGDGHIVFSTDLSDYSLFENIILKAVSSIGKIDGFIHCAGIEMTLPLQNMTSARYSELMSINTIAAFELSKIISRKKYLSENGASFIFLSSVTGLLGVSGKIGYCASKAALIGGAKAMAVELVSKKVRVNTVLPGMVETEMFQKIKLELPEESVNEIISLHPMGIGRPDDVANLCAFLLSDLSRWITGGEFIVDGGYSCK